MCHKFINMVTGVIYKYTSPDGNIYIGQTTNECHRRGSFFLSKHYGGVKFDEARRRFGPENFTYERLHIGEYADMESAKLDLDKWETHYIQLYNSVEEGYNSYLGNGVHLLPSTPRVYKESCPPPVKYPRQEEGARKQFKPVAQYDLYGNYIASYKSLSEASRCTGIDLTNISRCCKGKISRVRTFVFKFI